jgi:hypothetical protein
MADRARNKPQRLGGTSQHPVVFRHDTHQQPCTRPASRQTLREGHQSDFLEPLPAHLPEVQVCETEVHHKDRCPAYRVVMASKQSGERRRRQQFRGCRDRTDVSQAAVHWSAIVHSPLPHVLQRVPNRRFAGLPAASGMQGWLLVVPR